MTPREPPAVGIPLGILPIHWEIKPQIQQKSYGLILQLVSAHVVGFFYFLDVTLYL